MTNESRPLPVSDERLRSVAKQLYPGRILDHDSYPAEVYQIALLAEQVEYSEMISFFLREAHEIYNARFR